MKRRDFLRRWLWQMPIALMALSSFAYAEKASAWDWNDVQRWAYEVQDRSDNVYQIAMQEAQDSNPDQEFTLQLLWEVSVKADEFANRVITNPWGPTAYSGAAFRELYQAFYRADIALDYSPFSWQLRSEFQNLSFAMDRLRAEYNYNYVNNGWIYITYRDDWYFRFGYRHNRAVYWPIYTRRINNRRLVRQSWEQRWRNDRRRQDYQRDMANRQSRERQERQRWDNNRPQRERDRLDRNNDHRTPPRRDNDRRDNGRGGGDNRQQNPPQSPPRQADPRRDNGRGGDNRQQNPPQAPPRQADPRRDNGRGGDRVQQPPRTEPDRGGRGGGSSSGGSGQQRPPRGGRGG